MSSFADMAIGRCVRDAFSSHEGRTTKFRAPLWHSFRRGVKAPFYEKRRMTVTWQ